MTPSDLINRFWSNLSRAEKQALYAWACEDRTDNGMIYEHVGVCDEVLHQVELERIPSFYAPGKP